MTREYTFEDIERLGMHEPIVAACLTAYKFGHISREQCLIEAVFGLAYNGRELVERLTKLTLAATYPVFISTKENT